jgi:ABC-type sugar transport system ATPase subunit
VLKLSGGNQQKVFLAKWLLKNPKILIVDEPTHGIDIGTKYDFYQILQELAREGIAIIMISSELPELLGLCDNILVINNKRIYGTLSREEATEEKILKMAMAENEVT